MWVPAKDFAARSACDESEAIVDEPESIQNRAGDDVRGGGPVYVPGFGNVVHDLIEISETDLRSLETGEWVAFEASLPSLILKGVEIL